MELIENFEIIAPFVIFTFGLIFGSFANVCIYRLPQEKSVVFPASHCMKCSAPVRWFDNIPVLSWVILRGRCRACKEKFSIRYPFVELVMAFSFLITYRFDGLSWLLLEHLLLVFGLVTVSFIDIDHFILPDKFTLPGIVIGLVGSLINPERSAVDSFLGVLMGGGFLWAIAWFYFALKKQEGMGGGDIKLLAWIGAVIGWKSIPFVIICASMVGSFGGIFSAMRSKQGMQTVIPFGPYLALGAVLYIWGGQSLGDWYISVFFPTQN